MIFLSFLSIILKPPNNKLKKNEKTHWHVIIKQIYYVYKKLTLWGDYYEKEPTKTNTTEYFLL